MITHFVRTYLSTWLVILVFATLLPVAIGRIPLNDAAPRALFFGGLLAVYMTDKRFRDLNLWPIYANLRIRRWGLLSGSGVFALFTAILWTLLA